MSINYDADHGARPDGNLVLCDTITTRVAGCRYQATTPAVPGAPVQFVREPANAWDANAVAVIDMDGRRIGYLFREIAEEYAALMDCGCVRLCGRMAAPGEPSYDPVRAQSNPVLYVWVNAVAARLAEICAQADANSSVLGGPEESSAITRA
jgi:hypothetical protein